VVNYNVNIYFSAIFGFYILVNCHKTLSLRMPSHLPDQMAERSTKK